MRNMIKVSMNSKNAKAAIDRIVGRMERDMVAPLADSLIQHAYYASRYMPVLTPAKSQLRREFQEKYAGRISQICNDVYGAKNWTRAQWAYQLNREVERIWWLKYYMRSGWVIAGARISEKAGSRRRPNGYGQARKFENYIDSEVRIKRLARMRATCIVRVEWRSMDRKDSLAKKRMAEKAAKSALRKSNQEVPRAVYLKYAKLVGNSLSRAHSHH